MTDTSPQDAPFDGPQDSPWGPGPAQPTPAPAPQTPAGMPSPTGQARWGILSTIRKQEPWVAAAREVINLCFGEAKIDLRAATLSAPDTTIIVQGLFCDAKIIVPDTWRLECEGTAILGEFRQKSTDGCAPMDPRAPLVRVHGGVLLGECTVYRTSAAVGEGPFSVDGVAGWKARRQRKRHA